MAIDRGSGGSISGVVADSSSSTALGYAQAAIASATAAASSAAAALASQQDVDNNLHAPIVQSFTIGSDGTTLVSGITDFIVGTNALEVTLNGIDQTGAYSETSTTSITFSEGLLTGDVVVVRQVNKVPIGTLPASAVTYTTAGVTSNVQAKLDNLNQVQKVPSIAALRALRVPQGSDALTVIMDCYSVTGDQGGGLFYWNATSTAADDGGITINPTGNSGAGRWVRHIMGQPINPRWYGAKGDGSTDDTAAFQAFINYFVTNALAGIVPAGNYKITSQLNFSSRPGWSIQGVHRGAVTITQYTDNIPIFNLGSDTVSSLNGFAIKGITFDYANSQPSTNTNANPILFNTMVFEGEIKSCAFSKGSWAMRVATGIGCPWGVSFDDLVFQSGITGGAMDWSNGVNAVPNNHFGRLFCDCSNMVGPVFTVRGYNFVIDTIECIGANLGPTLFRLAAGGAVRIGAIKLENGTYNAGANLLDFQANCYFRIDQISIGGNNMNINPAAGSANSATVNLVQLGSGSSGYGEIGYINTAATTLSGNVFVVNSAARVRVGYVNLQNGWQLQNNGSTANGNNFTVDAYMNNQLSDNKGDVSYTVTAGDPNISSFETAFTAPRTIALPSVGQNMHNGMYYELRFYGAINGTNTAIIKSGSTTLITLSIDKVCVRFTWRRNANAQLGWVMTKYETLP